MTRYLHNHIEGFFSVDDLFFKEITLIFFFPLVGISENHINK